MVRPRGRLRGEVSMVTMATTLNMVTVVIVTLDMVNLCRLQVKGGVNLLH